MPRLNDITAAEAFCGMNLMGVKSTGDSPGIGSIAVLGCGNLGSALVRAFCDRLKIDPASIFVSDHDSSKIDRLVKSHSVVRSDSLQAASTADVVLIAVKPLAVEAAVREIAKALERDPLPLLISVAAGVTTGELRKYVAPKVRIARVMPNVACLIGQGASGVYSEDPKDADTARALFQGVGYSYVCSQESELDIVTAIGGSGPAFMFVAIEALADGAVRMGMGRESALRLAAETVRGAGGMVIETGEHPGKLKDAVASPGGTTIAGLEVLERNGFRGTLISAVEAATRRAADGKIGGKK